MLGLRQMTRGPRAPKAEEKNDGSGSEGNRLTPAALRMRSDFTQMLVDLPSYARVSWPADASGASKRLQDLQIASLTGPQLLNFEIDIIPSEGLWEKAKYTFQFTIPNEYPQKPPKVKLIKGKVYHPNIDFDGNVCLNVLKDQWRPVLEISQIIHGLNFLFVEPNGDDPLNLEAAKVYRDNRAQFERNVVQSLSGRSVGGHSFSVNKNNSF